MGVQIGAKPDCGFDNPLGMLEDCHRRIEKFLHILCIVAPRASGRSLTEEETNAVNAALQYFQEGGRRHNADEEESLFPRLRAMRPGDDQPNLARLEDEHRVTGELHEQVESLYRTWIDASALSHSEYEELIAATSELKCIYADHIKLEETTIFPNAAKVLDKATIATMGTEFQARRA